MATKFLPAMRARGHDFAVVTSHSGLDLPDESEHNGIPVFRFPFHLTLLNRNLRDMAELQQRLASLRHNFKPDLVHINSISPDTFFHLHTAGSNSAPRLVTMHGLPAMSSSGANNLTGKTLRSAEWVSAVSKDTLNKIREVVPEITPRSSVIYNGLDIPDVQPGPLPFNPPRLLCVGKLVAHKGFDLALTAFALLIERFPLLHLIIAGDGPGRSELEKLTSKLGLNDAVEFSGWVAPERIAELMNLVTLVVVPSRREHFGLVALQAAQMARPVVVTRVGGLPEVVVDRQTGLLVESEDSCALAGAIAFLLQHPDVARQLGQAARIRALDVFTLQRHVDSYEALYRRIVKEAA